MGGRAWTQAEDAIAMRLSTKLTDRELGAMLRRSPHAVACRLRAIGFRLPRIVRYSSEERQLVREFGPLLSDRAVGELLGRTSDAVKTMRRESLGVRYRQQRWSQSEEAVLRALHASHPNEDIALVLNRSVASVWAKAEYLGLEKFGKEQRVSLVSPELREVVKLTARLRRSVA